MRDKNSLSRQILAKLDAFAEFTGRTVAWLTLAMMAVTCLVVLLRYILSINLIFMQESVSYLHAMVFLLATAYTLKRDGHVRVDILYRRLAGRGKAWVNAVGALVFLLPVCGFILLSSWDFTLNAWRIFEQSPHANGIPAVFLLKSLIPLTAVLLALQGLAEVLRSMLVLGDENP